MQLWTFFSKSKKWFWGELWRPFYSKNELLQQHLKKITYILARGSCVCWCPHRIFWFKQIRYSLTDRSKQRDQLLSSSRYWATYLKQKKPINNFLWYLKVYNLILREFCGFNHFFRSTIGFSRSHVFLGISATERSKRKEIIIAYFSDVMFNYQIYSVHWPDAPRYCEEGRTNFLYRCCTYKSIKFVNYLIRKILLTLGDIYY